MSEKKGFWKFISYFGLIIGILVGLTTLLGVAYHFGRNHERAACDNEKTETNVQHNKDIVEGGEAVVLLTYRKPSTKIEMKLLASLKKLYSDYPNITVQPMPTLGIKNRNTIAAYLMHILIQAGFNEVEPTNWAGNESKPNLSIDYNPIDKNAAVLLKESLSILFNEEIILSEDGKEPTGKLNIFIVGDTMFMKDGSISFRSKNISFQ